MRGAGCTWNDIVDRDLDAMVERTRSRPIPSGQVSVQAAMVFLLVQALIGLAVLLQFNGFTVLTGIASLGIVAVYPFMKRVTYWPQIALGLAFSWGALMGWPAVFGRLDWPALSLYGGSIRFNTPMLFALGFMPMFGIGGLTGLPLGLAATDIPLHDTNYVVAHFHYLVAPGTFIIRPVSITGSRRSPAG